MFSGPEGDPAAINKSSVYSENQNICPPTGVKGARGVWEELKGIWCSIGWGWGGSRLYEEAGKSVIRLGLIVGEGGWKYISSFRQLIKHHCMYIAESTKMNEN